MIFWAIYCDTRLPALGYWNEYTVALSDSLLGGNYKGKHNCNMMQIMSCSHIDMDKTVQREEYTTQCWIRSITWDFANQRKERKEFQTERSVSTKIRRKKISGDISARTLYYETENIQVGAKAIAVDLTWSWKTRNCLRNTMK